MGGWRGLAGLAGVLGLWQLGDLSGMVPADYLPPPSVVLPTLIGLLGDPGFLLDVVATLLATAIAVLVSAAIAIPAGLLVGGLPFLRRSTTAVIEFLRTIPSVALIPLGVLLFGINPGTKIALAAYAAFWPVLFNTSYAVAQVEPVQVETARAFGRGRWGTLVWVALPSAAPFVLTGIRLAASIALVVVVSVEVLVGGVNGIGQVVVEASASGEHMDRILAVLVLAGVLGAMINTGLERLHGRLFAWTAQES